MHHIEVPTVDIAGLPQPLPDDVHLLDVREHVEWVNGHIEGALHIPLMELPRRLHEVPDGRTVVVCKIGGRSAQAVAYLRAHGREVVNLDGGMLEWAAAGRPMVSENGAAPRVV